MMSRTVTALAEPDISILPIRRILVAYDLSVFSEVALQYATVLAERFGAKVYVAHVEAPGEWTPSSKDEVKQARLEVESIARTLQKKGIDSAGVCRVGQVGDALAELVTELNPDLLIIGAYGHCHTDTRRLGSTAEFIMRSLPCATFVIGPAVAQLGRVIVPLKRILYASALHPNPARALSFVATLAQTPEAEVEIFHVTHCDDPFVDMRTRRELEIAAEHIASLLKTVGVNAHSQLMFGRSAAWITERAKQIASHLIVFGIEHHLVNHLVMGTISDVIQQAPCPVLTVPGPA